MNQLIIAALIAAAGFGSAWQIQSWRMDAKEKQRVEQQIIDERLASDRAKANQDAIIVAQNEAQSRARALRLDAAGTRTALIGLHDSAAEALRDAATSQAACVARANTLSELLETSAGRYAEMGEKADRHASDVQTLIGAWPR